MSTISSMISVAIEFNLRDADLTLVHRIVGTVLIQSDPGTLVDWVLGVGGLWLKEDARGFNLVWEPPV